MICLDCGHPVIIDSSETLKCQNCSSAFYSYKGELIPLKGNYRFCCNKHSDRNRTIPFIDHSICICCYKCIRICPTGSIILLKDSKLSVADTCNNCLRCMVFCRKKAISR